MRSADYVAGLLAAHAAFDAERVVRCAPSCASQMSAPGQTTRPSQSEDCDCGAWERRNAASYAHSKVCDSVWDALDCPGHDFMKKCDSCGRDTSAMRGEP